MEEVDSYKAQRSIVVFSRDSTMITNTEAKTEEVLDIPPINSYGGQKVQGYLDDSEHSEWVRHHMEEFSKQIEVSMEGFESVVMNLFVEIEKRWRQTGGGVSLGSIPIHNPRKGVRELKNLSTSINYETPRKSGRGRRGQGADCF